MENKDYQKNAGCCYGVMFVGLLGLISMGLSRHYVGMAIFAMLITFAAVMSYMAREDYKIYKSFQRRIQSRLVRDQLIYILKHQEGENAYLHYGTPEEFKRFEEYIVSLNGRDDYFDDFNEFLDKAKKYKRLK